jgi:nitrite reductase/ring-hydroxylating ferredoxin subunit
VSRQEHPVGPAAAIPPGGHEVVEVAGRQIGVFNVGGEYYALPNVCFHQNGPLCRGLLSGTVQADEASGWEPEWRLDGEVVICPWHSLEFHVKTGRCIAYPDRRLPTYPVRVTDGQLQVTL